ncbi:MAG: hypothetical protein ACLTSX_04095 [Collinsella sp.]
MAASGLTCVCNRAGNNMETGITGALLEASSERRRTAGTVRVGVFECDELYTVRVLPRLKPTHFVLLNLFRDQLDRYGEIDHTQDAIASALASSPETILIFNADDPLCTAIADRVPNSARGVRHPGSHGDRDITYGRVALLRQVQCDTRIRIPAVWPARRLPMPRMRLGAPRTRGVDARRHPLRRRLLVLPASAGQHGRTRP